MCELSQKSADWSACARGFCCRCGCGCRCCSRSCSCSCSCSYDGEIDPCHCRKGRESLSLPFPGAHPRGSKIDPCHCRKGWKPLSYPSPRAQPGSPGGPGVVREEGILIFMFFRIAFFMNFGSVLGPKNRPKLPLGSKKWLQRPRRMRFLSFSCAVAVRNRFSDRFLEGMTCENCAPATVGA